MAIRPYRIQKLWRTIAIRTLKGHIGIKSFDSIGFKYITDWVIIVSRNNSKHS
jgi:hypothetical protein